MIYVEFIERDRFMPLEIFRHLGDQAAWTDPEDTLIGSFGRTMRIGPMPSYLAFWKCKGMRRMDEWEAHLSSPEAMFDRGEMATHRAIHLQHGGCYDLLYETQADRAKLFCIEYLAVPTNVKDSDFLRDLGARVTKRNASLAFVLRRIGRLGPDPNALAVVSFDNYVAVESYERARDDADAHSPTAVGVYRWFGREVL